MVTRPPRTFPNFTYRELTRALAIALSQPRPYWASDSFIADAEKELQRRREQEKT